MSLGNSLRNAVKNTPAPGVRSELAERLSCTGSKSNLPTAGLLHWAPVTGRKGHTKMMPDKSVYQH